MEKETTVKKEHRTDWNLKASEEQWELFKGLYTSPKDIELFPAGMSEISETDGIVGPTFACIIGQQFKKLKYSDRYQQDKRRDICIYLLILKKKKLQLPLTLTQFFVILGTFTLMTTQMMSLKRTLCPLVILQY